MEQSIQDITDQIIASIGKEEHFAIPILQAIQKEFRYLPEEAMRRVAETTQISASRLMGISTFYAQFRHSPVGDHLIKICTGTACHVKGAMQVYDAFCRELNITGNNDTDAEMRFTIEKVACLGCCTIAPVVQIDEVTYGHVTTQNVSGILEDFLSRADISTALPRIVDNAGKVSLGEIRIGLGSCCVASGSREVKEALEKSLEEGNIPVDVKHVGCVGVCNQVPMLEVHQPGKAPMFYTKVKANEVHKIIHSHFKPSGIVNRIKQKIWESFEEPVVKDFPRSIRQYHDGELSSPITEFTRYQLPIATELRGELKPSDLSEYRKHGGFDALKKALQLENPLELIDILKAGGLQGRGGGGFPAGKKWELVKKDSGISPFVICNGDEGDPGAFMDRMLLESYPYRVIEGMMIAALAVGSREGYFYIRAEYPLAVERIKQALDECRNQGIVGENILGTNFSFNAQVFEGAGAFVCGEETALIASMEGQRGLPRLRPPYPAEKGLFGRPTLINNTETLAMVPWIIVNGADAFNRIGTATSKGTKVFALAGKINRGGLIEVPMGITIRTIVEQIGGGIPGGKAFKAVQIGGPSGGCLPAGHLDTPIDYQSLKAAGAMMGSGGLIVLDESDCMVDIARYFLSFTQEQSCGRCTFCRIGTKRMLEILDKITSGHGSMADLENLEKLAIQTQQGSMCGLGKTAPNPVLSTLRYFRHEYEAHINGQCPTGKCLNLVSYRVEENCIGCTKCIQRCPVDAISGNEYELHSIDTSICVKCDICRQICPVEAIKLS